MLNIKNYKIYFVAITNNNYEIMDINLKKESFILTPKNFGLNDNLIIYSMQNMEKDIHKIHNYIRDYTKISNEDKGFFIACILISFKKTSFLQILENYDTKLYI